MNDKNSYFECKRCTYTCNKKANMKKHLNRKILCIKNFDSFSMSDEELYNLSLIKIYIKPEDDTNDIILAIELKNKQGITIFKFIYL